MPISTLTSNTPASDSFTLTERTLVQGCILSNSELTGSEFVSIEVDTGSGFAGYKLSVSSGKPDDFYLAPGTYRAYLHNAKAASSVVLSLSPV